MRLLRAEFGVGGLVLERGGFGVGEEARGVVEGGGGAVGWKERVWRMWEMEGEG